MQVVSGTYTTKSGNNFRKPQFAVYVDWAIENTFQTETKYILSIEVERSLNEPLGGVFLAQADLELSNTNDRYTPTNE